MGWMLVPSTQGAGHLEAANTTCPVRPPATCACVSGLLAGGCPAHCCCFVTGLSASSACAQTGQGQGSSSSSQASRSVQGSCGPQGAQAGAEHQHSAQRALVVRRRQQQGRCCCWRCCCRRQGGQRQGDRGDLPEKVPAGAHPPAPRHVHRQHREAAAGALGARRGRRACVPQHHVCARPVQDL